MCVGNKGDLLFSFCFVLSVDAKLCFRGEGKLSKYIFMAGWLAINES